LTRLPTSLWLCHPASIGHVRGIFFAIRHEITQPGNSWPNSFLYNRLNLRF
jgi:hypothetical protein